MRNFCSLFLIFCIFCGGSDSLCGGEERSILVPNGNATANAPGQVAVPQQQVIVPETCSPKVYQVPQATAQPPMKLKQQRVVYEPRVIEEMVPQQRLEYVPKVEEYEIEYYPQPQQNMAYHYVPQILYQRPQLFQHIIPQFIMPQQYYYSMPSMIGAPLAQVDLNIQELPPNMTHKELAVFHAMRNQMLMREDPDLGPLRRWLAKRAMAKYVQRSKNEPGDIVPVR